MRCLCIKKELSAPFIAPENKFAVLLSYTQFFIFDKDLFGCYSFSDMIFRIVISSPFIDIRSFNLHFGQYISTFEPSPAFNNLYPQPGQTM
ncbi:MAG TPA: hypothetical protein DD415_06585 [Clostridiales bacterium]|nr:hypothetical protein [Clostridiales bacterium]